MDQTLTFHLLDDRAAFLDAGDEIDLAIALLNHRFTWTGDRLWYASTVSGAFHVRGEPSAAWGHIRVNGNLWNALLVTEFATWLSRRLPATRVLLLDPECLYVPVASVLLRAGVPRFDRDYFRWMEGVLRAEGLPERFPSIRAAEERARCGAFYADVPAADYADVLEIRALGIPQDEIARMTLREVAARFVFPWVTEGLGGA